MQFSNTGEAYCEDFIRTTTEDSQDEYALAFGVIPSGFYLLSPSTPLKLKSTK